MLFALLSIEELLFCTHLIKLSGLNLKQPFIQRNSFYNISKVFCNFLYPKMQLGKLFCNTYIKKPETSQRNHYILIITQNFKTQYLLKWFITKLNVLKKEKVNGIASSWLMKTTKYLCGVMSFIVHIMVLATLSLKEMKYFFLFSCFPYQNSCHKGLRKRINVLIHLIYTKCI